MIGGFPDVASKPVSHFAQRAIRRPGIREGGANEVDAFIRPPYGETVK